MYIRYFIFRFRFFSMIPDAYPVSQPRFWALVLDLHYLLLFPSPSYNPYFLFLTPNLLFLVQASIFTFLDIFLYLFFLNWISKNLCNFSIALPNSIYFVSFKSGLQVEYQYKIFCFFKKEVKLKKISMNFFNFLSIRSTVLIFGKLMLQFSEADLGQLQHPRWSAL